MSPPDAIAPRPAIALKAREGRRYQGIALDLTRRIEAREFLPGARLPPERELAQSLGVSRTTVREALLALELMGYVEIRVGAGVFVVPRPGDAIARAVEAVPDEVGPFEILEARRLIEGDIAFRAAQRAGEEELTEIRRNVEEMRAAIHDIPAFDQLDRRFHMLIAKAADNGLLERYVHHLWDLRGGALWRRWYDRTRHPGNRRRSTDDHARIARALSRRLPEQAATAMRAHIDVLAGRFLDLDMDADQETE